MTGIWIPTPARDEDDERVKDVFAHYGLAMYKVAILEVNLVQAFAVSNIRDAKETQTLIRDPWVTGYKTRLVDLIAFVGEQPDSNAELITELEKCRSRRNALAHSYWRDHDVEFCSRAGQERMTAALQEDVELFTAATKHLEDSVLTPLHRKLGYTPEMFDAEFRRLYREATGE
jgi:hypothetical protein